MSDMKDLWKQPDADVNDLKSIFKYALTIDGYTYAKEFLKRECGDLANESIERYHDKGIWEGSFEELRCCLFFEQRRWRHFGEAPTGKSLEAIRDLYLAIADRWQKRAPTP